MGQKMQGDNLDARTEEALIENDGMGVILHTPNGEGDTVCGAEVHSTNVRNVEADESDDAWCDDCASQGE